MSCEIIYYSATDCTKKIVEAFSKGLSDEVYFSKLDMFSFEKAEPSTADLVVLAAPVYGGRIPVRIMKCFEKRCPKGKMIVGIVVYGNIHFGGSLKQINQLAISHNCLLVGAGAFIGEHTFSVTKATIAEGRPNEKDLEQARKFAIDIQEKINRGIIENKIFPLSKFPIILTKFSDISVRLIVKKPIIINDCNLCGVCYRCCPSRAINKDTLEIDDDNCIRCFACVKKCPKNARRAELRINFLKYLLAYVGRKIKEPIWKT